MKCFCLLVGFFLSSICIADEILIKAFSLSIPQDTNYHIAVVVDGKEQEVAPNDSQIGLEIQEYSNGEMTSYTSIVDYIDSYKGKVGLANYCYRILPPILIQKGEEETFSLESFNDNFDKDFFKQLSRIMNCTIETQKDQEVFDLYFMFSLGSRFGSQRVVSKQSHAVIPYGDFFVYQDAPKKNVPEGRKNWKTFLFIQPTLIPKLN